MGTIHYHDHKKDNYRHNDHEHVYHAPSSSPLTSSPSTICDDFFARFLVAPNRFQKLQNETSKDKRLVGVHKRFWVIAIGVPVPPYPGTRSTHHYHDHDQDHEITTALAIAITTIHSFSFPGNPLDPPLRSRFQCRRVDSISTRDIMKLIRAKYAPSAPSTLLYRLLAFAEAIKQLSQDQAGKIGIGNHLDQQ